MKQQNINSNEQIKNDCGNSHYSFHRMNKGIGKYVWTWILIFCFLTPQFSYNTEAKNFFKKVWDESWDAVTDTAEVVVKDVIEPVAHALLPEEWRDFLWNKNPVRKGIKEGERFGHKVEKYTIRPVSDPRLIGKVAAIAIVAYFCPPAWGTLAGTGGIMAAGATSATYDKFVFKVSDRDAFKSFLTGAGSATVTAAFDNYIPVKKEVVDPVTGVKTEVILLSKGEQYLRGVAISASHIAVGQATSLIVDGKGTLGGRAWSGALAGAFVPSVQLVTDNNLVATLVDPINRSVVEQSVVNRFNMKKVDFGAAVTSGAQALRDQYVKEKATEFAKFVENWYGVKPESLPGKREIEQKKSSLQRKWSDKDIIDFMRVFPDSDLWVEWMKNENILNYILDLKEDGYSMEEIREHLWKNKPEVFIKEPNTWSLLNLVDSTVDCSNGCYKPLDPLVSVTEEDLKKFFDKVVKTTSTVADAFEDINGLASPTKPNKVISSMNRMTTIGEIGYDVYNDLESGKAFNEAIVTTVPADILGAAFKEKTFRDCMRVVTTFTSKVKTSTPQQIIAIQGAGGIACFFACTEMGNYVSDNAKKVFTDMRDAIDDEMREYGEREIEKVKKNMMSIPK